MRVALVFPNYWPYVRRGAERLMAEYAQALIAAGHRVDIITSKPGPRRVDRQDRLTIYYESQIDHPLLARRWEGFRLFSFSLNAAPHLLRRRYDAVHIWLYPYGLSARMARAVRGTPYLYHSMAADVIAPPGWQSRLLHEVARRADRVATLTHSTAAVARERLGRPVDVLPGCVDLEAFAPVVARDTERPRVLFVSDWRVTRKGATLLLMAWDEIHRRCPSAVLTFAGPSGRGGLLEDADPAPRLDALVHDRAARAAIEFVGEGRVADLPHRYAEASVTVLPSVGEAFGLVLLESLACGTPVVGNAHEGPGEIITDPAIGATVPLRDFGDLASPARAHDLAEAVLHAIDLAADPRTVDRCRDHARPWSRTSAGERLVEIYRAMIGDAAGRRGGEKA
jgi:phosphatidylinositol alpha-mannosyltransferase